MNRLRVTYIRAVLLLSSLVGMAIAAGAPDWWPGG